MHTQPDVDAVEAALRQLPPRAERLLRTRFGLGMARRGRLAAAALPKQHWRQLEASAYRALRLNALGARSE